MKAYKCAKTHRGKLAIILPAAVMFTALVACADIIVDDTPVTGEVVVGANETLAVYGNGLGADASVSLAGKNASIVFYATATIAAPVTITAAVETWIKTIDSSVTGTVAGTITQNTTAGDGQWLHLASPGLLVLSGGGSMKGVAMRSGRVDVTGTYNFGGWLYMRGGHMKIRDGGKIDIKSTWQRLQFAINSGADTCLEIADGGTFTISAGNCSAYIGDGSAYESKVLLTGGTFNLPNLYTYQLNKGGVIEVRSGTFSSQKALTVASAATADNAKILLKGGTWNANGATPLFAGTGKCEVRVEDNSTFKFTSQTLADSTAETPQATWTCAEGARLKVIGGNYTPSTLMLHDFQAQGLYFDFNTDGAYTVNVAIADPTDPLAVGCVLPGKSGSRVSATGANPALVASYIVPDGATFSTASPPTAWHSGFSSASVSNVIFEAGSTLVFPFFSDALSPFAISGSLKLPSAMNYAVDVHSGKCQTAATRVVVPALGVEQDVPCAWTTPRLRGGEMTVADGSLWFSYKPIGFVLIVE